MKKIKFKNHIYKTKIREYNIKSKNLRKFGSFTSSRIKLG